MWGPEDKGGPVAVGRLTAKPHGPGRISSPTDPWVPGLLGAGWVKSNDPFPRANRYFGVRVPGSFCSAFRITTEWALRHVGHVSEVLGEYELSTLASPTYPSLFEVGPLDKANEMLSSWA